MITKRLAPLVVGLGLLALSGCGEKFSEVSGTVSLGGKPLEAGVVTFFPEKGLPVAASVQNGSYTAVNVPFGPVRVTVTPLQTEAEVTAGPGGPVKPGQEDPTAKQTPAPKKPAGPIIPEKYTSVDTSGLSTKVEQEKVTFPIDLK